MWIAKVYEDKTIAEMPSIGIFAVHRTCWKFVEGDVELSLTEVSYIIFYAGYVFPINLI